ncbi:MAG TPA: DUF1634 domain-containing protein [Terriglobia bacterium]|nr:DUF1634 domain-containing protein [Terriglobia bacterium]
MTESRGQWDDQRTEMVIGILIQAGVLVAAGVVLAGAIVFLLGNGSSIPSYHVFQGEPTDLRTLSGIFHDAIALEGRGIIQLGLLILIATPVARVVFSIVAFALERDTMYVVITLIVLAILIFSLSGGHF